MAFGKLGARGGFGSLGSLGRPGNSSSAPTVVMALVSGSTFSFTFSPQPVAGDTLRLEARAAGGSDWLTLLYDNTHTITQPEIDSGTLSLTASGLASGNYEASSIYHHTTDSARSNVVSFTVAGTANARISSTGNNRISSAGNNRKYA